MPPKKGAKAAAQKSATATRATRGTTKANGEESVATKTRPKRGATTTDDEPPAKKTRLSADAGVAEKGKGNGAKKQTGGSVATSQPQQAKGRGRGRPAKTMTAESEVEEGEEAVPKRRGRPPRASEVVEEPEQKTNRGRGRPAKSAANPEVSTRSGRGQTAKSKQVTSAPGLASGRGRRASKSAEVDTRPATTSKKRGRAAKSSESGTEPLAKTSAGRQSAKAPAPKTNNVPKPKGRPAKTAATKTVREPVRKTASKAAASSKPRRSKSPDVQIVGKTNLAVVDEAERPFYWLMKAEPEPRFEDGVDVSFPIDKLAEKTEPEPWDGVRNPVATKNMKTMKKGELAFFYHSNCKIPGIAGLMEIVEEAQVDESAFDPSHHYYDAKSNRDKPRWYCVKVAFRERFTELVPLKELHKYGKDNGVLSNMQVLKLSRLSVSKVSKGEWDFIMDNLVDTGDGKSSSVKEISEHDKSKVAAAEEPVLDSKTRDPVTGEATGTNDVDMLDVSTQHGTNGLVAADNFGSEPTHNTNKILPTILPTVEAEDVLNGPSLSSNNTNGMIQAVTIEHAAEPAAPTINGTSTAGLTGLQGQTLKPANAAAITSPGSRTKSAQPSARPLSSDQGRARSAQPERASIVASNTTGDTHPVSLFGGPNDVAMAEDSTFDGVGDSFVF